MTIIWFGGSGTITADMVQLFATDLPALIAGAWLGWKLFGQIDETTFRKIVLGVLLVSGVMQVLTGL